MTSHDVVARLRSLTKQRQIGHTGTLDPLATGLMICLLGRATRLSPYLTHLDKTYECEGRLGLDTDTYDIEGREVARWEGPLPDRAAVAAALSRLVGEIEQTPPLYSAIQVKGRRLHQYARAGEQVEVPSRRVRVNRLELTSFEPPRFQFVAEVSAGAYIRSLCHDAGRTLGCGACVTALRRLSVGAFRVGAAATLSELDAQPQCCESRLLSPAALLPHMVHLRTGADGCSRLLHGVAAPASLFDPEPDARMADIPALAVDANGEAVAIVRVELVDSPGSRLTVRPIRGIALS